MFGSAQCGEKTKRNVHGKLYGAKSEISVSYLWFSVYVVLRQRTCEILFRGLPNFRILLVVDVLAACKRMTQPQSLAG
jgi:hypothetical protein